MLTKIFLSYYLPRTSILPWNQGFCCSWVVRRRFPKLQALVPNIRDEVFGHHEHQKWHDVFTSVPGNYFVLVHSFFHKLNWLKPTNALPKLASFDMLTSEPLLAQNFGCIRRLDQQRVAKIYEYFIAGSFNARQLRRNVWKAVPVSLRPLPLTIRPRH